MQNLQIELLQLLQQDCRMPLEKLAVMLGQPMDVIGGMIDELEKRGIILRYAPVINWDKTDRERVEAMPRSPITVSYPCGVCRINASACAARAAARTASMVRRAYSVSTASGLPTQTPIPKAGL